METAIMRHAHPLRMGTALALLCAAAALPCAAQGGGLVIACEDPSRACITITGDVITNLQDAVDEAVDLSRATGRRAILLIVPTYDPLDPNCAAQPWHLTDGIRIPADANIHIIGSGLDRCKTCDNTITDQRFMPVHINLTNTGGLTPEVFRISTADFAYEGGPANQLIIEGLKITGGETGIRMDGDPADPADVFRPTINRCWISENATDGVRVEGLAQPMLVNNSISDNGRDGVRIDSAHPSLDTLAVDIIHCSIISNGIHGVYAASQQNARVRNSLVYLNGSGPAQNEPGGLVWSENLSIDPNWDYVPGGAATVIRGSNLTVGPPTDVYFGPIMPETRSNTSFVPVDPNAIGRIVPPSYTGAPGVVDVHIQRGDGRLFTIPNGFRYLAGETRMPVVLRVDPVKGPRRGGNWVWVQGFDFSPNCEVWLDADGVFSTGTDVRVEEFEYRSSTLLYARMPEAWSPADPFAVYVRVRNTDLSKVETDWLVSPPTYDAVYFYTGDVDDPPGDNLQPEIHVIVPDSGTYDDLGMETQILGYNFADDAQVFIGGIPCLYEEVVHGAVVNLNGVDKRLTQLRNVRVPVTLFEAAGKHDVEVINPNGRNHILFQAFTVYMGSDPVLNDRGLLPPPPFAWEIANFLPYNTFPMLSNTGPMGANTAPLRTLRGQAFATGIEITFANLEDDTQTYLVNAGGEGWVRPEQFVNQHRRHTPTSIEFMMPLRPYSGVGSTAFLDVLAMPPAPAFTPVTPDPNTFSARVSIRNVKNGLFEDVGADKAVSTEFFWVRPANYFAIGETLVSCPPDLFVVSVGGGANVGGWAPSDIDVYVGHQQVPDAAIGVTSWLFGALVTFPRASVPAGPGFHGLQDVAVVLRRDSPFNDFGKPLYAVRRDALYIEPQDAWNVTGTSARPRHLPALPEPDREPRVRIRGSGFLGPYIGPPNNNFWPFTDVVLRWDDGGPQELRLSQLPSIAPGTNPDLTIASFNEIQFTAFDVNTGPLTVPISTLGDVRPVDVVLRTYGGCPTGDMNAPRLPSSQYEDTIIDALIFWDLTPGYSGFPRIDLTYVRPETMASGVGGVGGLGTFTVGGAGWSPGAFVDNYLVDSAGESFIILGNTTTQLTLLSSAWPASGSWRIIRGALPLRSGLGAIRDSSNTYRVTLPVALTPHAYRGLGLLLTDASNNSYLIVDNSATQLHLKYAVPSAAFPEPAGGLWRISAPIHWGFASGGEVLAIEGDHFITGNQPVVRIGPGPARLDLATYNTGYMEVVVPPAPLGLPGTYDVSAAWSNIASPGIDDTSIEVFAPSESDNDQRYTYVSDGKPIITMITPNQVVVDTAATPQQPVQTLRIVGHNFTDSVTLYFQYGANPEVVLPIVSRSPNEIEVRAPFYASMAIPNTPGEYDVWVWVGNSYPSGRDADDYLSNQVPVWYAVNSSDAMDLVQPVLEYNDVYQNTSLDYLRVGPGIGSTRLHPRLMTPDDPALNDPTIPTDIDFGMPWWRGKIRFDSPIIDIARTHVDAGVNVSRDFENQTRPTRGNPASTGPFPDMGADEYFHRDTIPIPSWFLCDVYPDPVPEIASGELDILLGVTYFDAGSAYIVPQGEDPLLTYLVGDPRIIELDLTPLGGGYYLATNRNPITTILKDAAVAPDIGRPTIADGHAAVLLDASGYLLGDNIADLSDGGLIVEQAVLGRHFLIDTVPPVPVLTVNPAAGGLDLTALDNAPGPYAAQGVTMGTLEHPYPALPAGWRPIDVASPFGAPYDGTIDNIPGGIGVTDRTHVFYNVGSESNTYPPEALQVRVGVQAAADPSPYGITFVDLPPMADDGTVMSSYNYWIGADGIQPAGFPPTPLGPQRVDAVDDGPTQVFFVAGTNLPVTTTMFYDYETSWSDPLGLGVPAVFAWPLDRLYADPNNNTVGSVWRFEDTVGNPGIPATAVAFGPMRLGMKFLAEDLAGNRMLRELPPVPSAVDPFYTALDPLHLWWMTRVRTEIYPNLEGLQVDRVPSVAWRIGREATENPGALEVAAQPRYTWRLWISDEYDGVYTQYTGWSPWSELDGLSTGDADALTDALRAANLVNVWLLLVAAGADEAGNVQPWSATGLPPEGPVMDMFGVAGPGRNWMRFYLGGAPAPDTLVTAEFWHDALTHGLDPPDADDRRLGSVNIVPLHPTSPELTGDPNGTRVAGRFYIRVVAPEIRWDELSVEWELYRIGEIIPLASGTESVDADYRVTAPVALPDPASVYLDIMPGTPADDPREVNYVFRARAIHTTPVPPAPDPTPANVYFTVVSATSIEEYVELRRLDGKQPVKMWERD